MCDLWENSPHPCVVSRVPGMKYRRVMTAISEYELYAQEHTCVARRPDVSHIETVLREYRKQLATEMVRVDVTANLFAPHVSSRLAKSKSKLLTKSA